MRDDIPEGGLLGQVGDVKSEFGVIVRNKNFMRLFWGQLVSSLGDWVTTLALISLVYRLTNKNALAVGGMLAFRIVPALFSGPVAAVVSDRFDRRKLMIGCDISRGIIVCAAPFMTRLWALYILIFLIEGISIVWLAARDASIPNLVEEDQLTMANSLSMATTYGMIPFAAVLFSLIMLPSSSFTSGSFLAQHPTFFAFIVDAASFFVSASFFMRMHLESPKHYMQLEESWRIRESITFAIRNPFSRSLMLGAAMGCIGGGSLYAVGIGYMRQVVGAKSDVAFGILMALFGIGMILGVVALQVLVKHEEKPYMLRIALLVAGGIMIGMSFVRWLPLVYILAGFFGAAFGILFLVAVTLVQERIEDKDRGKAFAAFHAVSRIFLIVGAGLSGGIAGIVKVRTFSVFGMTITVYGVSLALFVAGILIASVSVVPLGEKKKERYRDYFVRKKNQEPVSETTGSGDHG
jgi:dTMP kinase